MKLRFLLSLFLMGLMMPSWAGLKEDAEETVGKDLVLTSAEFGLVEQAADGTVQIKPVDKIPLVPGQTYGWRLKLRTKREVVALREEVQLPVAPKTWNSAIPEAEFRVSPDGRTGVTMADATLTDGTLMNAWKVAEGDPLGEYSIKIYLDGKLVRTFKFEAVAK